MDGPLRRPKMLLRCRIGLVSPVSSSPVPLRTMQSVLKKQAFLKFSVDEMLCFIRAAFFFSFPLSLILLKVRAAHRQIGS